MKRKHITLPSLQVAATAFLALNCSQAVAERYCVNKTTSKVVAAENCEGDVGDFTTVDGAPDAALVAVIAKRQDTDDHDEDDKIKSKRDSELMEFTAKLIYLKLVAGGFGNGGGCDCSSSGGQNSGSSGGHSGGSGGGGSGVVVGGWTGTGGRGG
jgi:hypothetical protein